MSQRRAIRWRVKVTRRRQIASNTRLLYKGLLLTVARFNYVQSDLYMSFRPSLRSFRLHLLCNLSSIRHRASTVTPSAAQLDSGRWSEDRGSTTTTPASITWRSDIRRCVEAPRAWNVNLPLTASRETWRHSCSMLLLCRNILVTLFLSPVCVSSLLSC